MIILIGALSAALAISIDAFVVAACEGVKSPQLSKSSSFNRFLLLSVILATTSSLLLATGYFVRREMLVLLDRYDHWVAFGLLVFVSLQYCYEALPQGFLCRRRKRRGAICAETAVPCAKKEVTLLADSKALGRVLLRYFMIALATGIDALALGFSLSGALGHLLLYVIVVFVVTFVAAEVGALTLRSPKKSFLSLAKVLAAAVLLGIAFKILYTHGVF